MKCTSHGRAVEVDRDRMQARHQDAELTLVAGRRQRRPPHVVIELDLVLHPCLQRVLQEVGRTQAQVPRRVHRDLAAKLVGDLAQERGRRIGRQREREHAADVHHRLARLGREEHGVHHRQILGGHFAAACSFPHSRPNWPSLQRVRRIETNSSANSASHGVAPAPPPPLVPQQPPPASGSGASSIAHVAEQPSPPVSLPSSQVSPSCSTPSPQRSSTHALLQPSPLTRLPSSHASPG